MVSDVEVKMSGRRVKAEIGVKKYEQSENCQQFERFLEKFSNKNQL